jgi:hypothetical protein
MPYRRATTETLPPAAATSANSADFSDAFHFRRRVMISDPDTAPPSGALQKDSNQAPSLPKMHAAPQHGQGRALTLQLDQVGDGVVPSPRAAAMVGRATRADHRRSC